uniref:ribonuclease H n=1 Tax=Pelodiscus sinensis TaxID=13735 RepID=K7FUX2_PELSI
LKLTWKTDKPVWVDQWPLKDERLLQVQKLVKEHLALGHIVPSTSPWNTPIFTIPQKSGKWRLLQDLRAINAVMEQMGPLQLGVPSPSMIPEQVIDLKDCFTTIPLHPDDFSHFAFSVPTVNNEGLMQRYHWVVLPQGMMISPTICQIVVDSALTEARTCHQQAIIYHYMDDILFATADQAALQALYDLASRLLRRYGLCIAEEKVQAVPPWRYLGWKLYESEIRPQPLKIATSITTLNDLQKLLGTINWIQPTLGVTTEELSPLFQLLRGNSDLSSPRALTPKAVAVLQRVVEKIQTAFGHRRDAYLPIGLFLIYHTYNSPVSPNLSLLTFEWLFLPHSFSKTVTTATDMLARLISQGRVRCQQLTGVDPSVLHIPVTRADFDFWLSQSLSLQIALADYLRQIEYTLPCHQLLQSLPQLPLQPRTMLSHIPLPGARTVFVDGSGNTGKAIVVWRDGDDAPWNSDVFRVQGSTQIVELAVAVRAFELFLEEQLNLVVDSALLQRLESSFLKEVNNRLLFQLLLQLSRLLLAWTHLYFVVHIRSHTTLPGP